jgi:iron complex outermembrane recepter protein
MTCTPRPVRAALLSTTASSSDGITRARAAEFADLSIEELMNVEVAWVSHKTQRAGDVATAFSVVTMEDIGRAGMTTVPQLLRLVPDAQVALTNSTSGRERW